MKVVQIVSMIVVGVTATLLALFVDTIYGIFILTADIVYVVIFPQFTCAVFLPFVNTYGSFLGFVLGTILRFGGGEPSLSLDPFIKYPYYDDISDSYFLSKPSQWLPTLFPLLLFLYFLNICLNTTFYLKGEITGKILPSPSKVDISNNERSEEKVTPSYYDSSSALVGSEVTAAQTKF